MIKAIIFDCFGVLIMNDLHASINAIEEDDAEAGRALHDVMRASDRGMLTRQEYMAQLGEIMHIEPVDLMRKIDNSIVKNEALLKFIRTLHPEYKLAVLSNVSGRVRLDQLFDSGELDEVFDVVIASGDVGIIKPERTIYEMTAQKLGVEPEDCVMVDDIRGYCDGAEAVGMQSILFTSTGQAITDLQTLIDSER